MSDGSSFWCGAPDKSGTLDINAKGGRGLFGYPTGHWAHILAAMEALLQQMMYLHSLMFVLRLHLQAL